MPLQPGARLGPYQIDAPLGAGGMGEVYRARDTRLDRSVAIKVLPGHLSSNPELRQRFEREARAVSSLNHPNICTLHDVGHENGTDFLVMELLEGETLAARVDKGPLPTDDLLRYGIQIADALDKAHRQGLIHRDLKPGNVMLTKSGAKLLDFGLARSSGLGPVSDMSASPTLTRPLTAEGAIVGTFQYMAPEQLEGKDADVRSDIWALGAVLYEMATGRRAFEAKTQASLIASILKDEPASVSVVKPLLPPALERLIRTCMAKDPDERFQNAHDVVLQLRWIAEGGSQAGVAAPVAARRTGRERAAWIAAGVAGVIAIGAVTFALTSRRGSGGDHDIRFDFGLPPALSSMDAPRISPDGRWIALIGADTSGKASLWIRPLDALAPVELQGTQGATRPFWSPDSRYLGYFVEGKLKKVSAAGGPPQTICDAPGGADGAWGKSGVILFDGGPTDSIRRVPSTGGTPTAATSLDRSRSETGHSWPAFLPDGNHFIYQAAGSSNQAGMRVGSLDSRRTRTLPGEFSRTLYASPGYVIFVRDFSLMAQRFDARSLSFKGEAVPIVDDFGPATSSETEFSCSTSGALTYLAGARGGNTRAVWLDRTGKEIGTLGSPAIATNPAIAPDGARVALNVIDPRTSKSDLWIYEPSRGIASRLTFDAENEVWPTWSPDGSQIVFASDRRGRFELYRKAATGVGEDERILETQASGGPTDWSRDGRFIAFQIYEPARVWDIWIVAATGDHKPIVFLATPFAEQQPKFSPDGRWLAYVSNESGRNEVYVQTFPSSGGKWQVSTQGGVEPEWRADGKELFYKSADGHLMAAPVTAGSTFTTGVAVALFESPRRSGGIIRSNYAVDPDGKRFLFVTPISTPQAVRTTVVTAWVSLLPKR